MLRSLALITHSVRSRSPGLWRASRCNTQAEFQWKWVMILWTKKTQNKTQSCNALLSKHYIFIPSSQSVSTIQWQLNCAPLTNPTAMIWLLGLLTVFWLKLVILRVIEYIHNLSQVNWDLSSFNCFRMLQDYNSLESSQYGGVSPTKKIPWCILTYKPYTCIKP